MTAQGGRWERVGRLPAALPLFEWQAGAPSGFSAAAIGGREPPGAGPRRGPGRVASGEPDATAGSAERAGRRRSAGPGRPVVVFVHGLSGSHEEWNDVAPRLAGQARVLAVDLPGHGAAVSAEYLGRCSMERATDAFEAALQAAGIESCLLVGYSLGGRFALYVSIERPQLVAGLILEGAGPGIADYSERRRRREADQKLAVSIEREGIEAFTRRWERVPIIAGYEELLSEPARRKRREARLSCSRAGLAASLRGMGAGRQPWLGDRLAGLTVPVHLVTGARDEKYTQIAREMMARIAAGRNGSPVTTNGAGRAASSQSGRTAAAAGGAGDAKGADRRVPVRHTIVDGAGHNVHATHPEEFAGIVAQTLSLFDAPGAAAGCVGRHGDTALADRETALEEHDTGQDPGEPDFDDEKGERE